MNRLRCILATVSVVVTASAADPPPTAVPDSTLQLVVGLADDWSGNRGKLQCFARKDAASPWKPALDTPVSILLGRNGLAWGRGLIPVPHGQRQIPSKQEKDFRAPAGCFRIGTLFGYAAQLPNGAALPYHQVTARDCWVDDVTSPNYNRHVTVDLQKLPSWYEKQRMRLGDSAYEWMLEIRHNADPPIPGAGSAIFFHVRRGPDKPSAGCTTMAKEDLLRLISWLRSDRQPCYVLLPRNEYAARLKSWHLPIWAP